jgi:hypothetical protein
MCIAIVILYPKIGEQRRGKISLNVKNLNIDATLNPLASELGIREGASFYITKIQCK